MGTRVDRANRVILALLGTALLALASLGLARSLGWLGQSPPAEPLLPADGAVAATDAWWVRPAVAALAFALALLCVRWLVAQAQRERVRHLEVDPSRNGGDTWLRTAGLAEAVEAEVEGYPGVDSARMTLVGTSGRHRHRLVVTLSDRADINAVRALVTSTTIPHLHRALDFDPPDVDVELVLAPRERRQLR